MKVSDYLTESKLRELYEEKLLKGAEIVDHLNELDIKFDDDIYQGKINRLRRKYSIPTITKAARIEKQVPDITPTQHELLIGSLLGDGRVSKTSEGSARFSEGHSEAQSGYLKWKADILAPFMSDRGIYKTSKKTEDKEYPHLNFYTKSCPTFWPYYEMFYTGPGGKREFPDNLTELLTPFSLAVWYMDDGHLGASKYHPSITFGLDDESLTNALTALRSMGFRPTLYRDRRHGTYSITFPGQDVEFFDVVSPHIPDCMSYKVPDLSQRKLNDINADNLTHTKAVALETDGHSVSDIADKFDVSESTVKRRLGSDKKPMGRPKSLYSRMEANAELENIYRFDLTKKWGNMNIVERNSIVGSIMEVATKSEFPFPKKLSEDDLRTEFQKVRARDTFLEGDYIRPRSYLGVGMCKPYFPNRYKAVYPYKLSVYDEWNVATDMKRAVETQVRRFDPESEHNPLTLERILIALSWQSKTPTIFRPLVTKYICQRYAPGPCVIWDACSGYGGRLVGALAADMRYIGTDVDLATVNGNRQLASDLGLSELASVHHSPAEEFDPGEPLDLVFTSPPYFNRERYSTSEGQSYLNYGDSAEDWVDGFLKPVFETAYFRLKDGAYMVINIADLDSVNKDRKTVPLVELTKRTASELGFGLESMLKMPLSGRRDHEPVLVFRK